MLYCKKCNQTKSVLEFSKNRAQKKGYQNICKSCKAIEQKEYRKTKHGHLGICFSGSKSRAKQKNIPFNLTVEYLHSIAVEYCPIFKTPFDWGLDSKGRGGERPSLDRIIPELGYVKGNVAFISMRANLIKQDVTDKELYAVANWIHEKRKYVKENTTTPVPTGSYIQGAVGAELGSVSTPWTWEDSDDANDYRGATQGGRNRPKLNG